jgi:hypothetical protein
MAELVLKALILYIIAGHTIIPLVHEAGHALVGLLAGLRVYFFGVGDHKPFFKIRLGGTFFYIARQRSIAGVTCIDEPDGSRTSALRLALFGGLAAELVVCLPLGAAALFTPLGQSQWFLALIIAWGAHFLYGLMPVRTSAGGMTDILHVVRLGAGARTARELEGALRSQKNLLDLAIPLGHFDAERRIREKIERISAAFLAAGGEPDAVLEPAEPARPAWALILQWFSHLTLFAAIGALGYMIHLTVERPYELYIGQWRYNNFLYVYYVTLCGFIVRAILRRRLLVGGWNIVLFFIVVAAAVYVVEIPSRETGMWTKAAFKRGVSMPVFLVRPGAEENTLEARYSTGEDGVLDEQITEPAFSYGRIYNLTQKYTLVPEDPEP